MRQTIEKELVVLETLTAISAEEVEQLRIKYLGKKGLLNDLFAKFKDLPSEDKKEMGAILNNFKSKVENKIASLKENLDNSQQTFAGSEDLTKPSSLQSLGSRHPLTIVRNEIINIFQWTVGTIFL